MFRLRQAWLGLVALAAALTIVPSARAADPKLLPGDTEWVFSFNLKQILDSELVKANRDALDQLLDLAKNRAPDDPGAEKFLKAADFDPIRDMVSLSVAGPAGVDPDRLVVIVEGKFKADKVHGAAQEFAKAAGDAVKVTMIGGVRVYEISVPGEKTAFASLVDENTLVLTPSKDIITEVIARAAGGKKGHKKEFRTLTESLNPRQSLSFAATGNAITTGIKNAPKIPKADKIADVLSQVQGIAGSLTVKKAIEFQLNVTAADADTAKTLAQGAEFGLSMVKAMVQGKADADPKFAIAADILRTLRVSSKGSDLVLRGEITADILERIFKSIGK